MTLLIVAFLVFSGAAAKAEPGPARFDDGVDAGAALRSLRSSAPQVPEAPFPLAFREVMMSLDPTCAPYPDGAAALAAEQTRVAAWLAPRAAALPPAQAQLLRELRATGISDVDLLHGSQAIVRDGGALYRRWASMGAVPRTSSHYPGSPARQYGIALPQMGSLLFGLDPAGNTWFQMEAFGADPAEAFEHLLEFARHTVTIGMNVGPLGLSPRSDARHAQIVLAGR